MVLWKEINGFRGFSTIELSRKEQTSSLTTEQHEINDTKTSLVSHAIFKSSKIQCSSNQHLLLACHTHHNCLTAHLIFQICDNKYMYNQCPIVISNLFYNLLSGVKLMTTVVIPHFAFLEDEALI